MNCAGARKLLYAFADSQLGVKDNCEVLDHLKMCPECSRIVDEHQALRGAIGRNVHAVEVPESLRSKLHSNMPAARPGAASSRVGSWRLIRPWAIAATILLGIGLLKTYVWPGSGSSGDSEPRVAQGPIKVEQGQGAAKAIADVHNLCCLHFASHQSRSLPTSVKDLGVAITAHFNNRIAALAPDLAAFGYQFESANFCGVQDKPGSDGGHILYVADKSRNRLSFFSVPRWDCLDKCGNRGLHTSDDCRKYEVDQNDGGKLSIIAWHNDATTYICCGHEPFEKLSPMIKQVRTALMHLDREMRFASAQPQP